MPHTPEQLEICQRILDAVTHFKDGFKTFDEMLDTIAGDVAAVKAPQLKFDPHSYDTEARDGSGNWYYDLPHADLDAARERFAVLEAGGLKARIMRRNGHLVLGVVEVSKI